MVIAGLDGATRSGLAILDGERLIHWEAFRPKGDTDAEIFRNFRIHLRAALVAHDVEAACLEQPLRTDLSVSEEVPADQSDFGGYRASARVKKPIGTMRTFLRLYGIRAHAIEIFASLNLDGLPGTASDEESLYEVNNKTWRSGIYGKCSPPKGTSNPSEWWKKKALDHCATVMKWPVTSKDAAEAALLAEYFRCQLNPRLAQANDLFAQQAGSTP